MGHRITIAFLILVGLGCVAGAVYWLKARNDVQGPALASPPISTPARVNVPAEPSPKVFESHTAPSEPKKRETAPDSGLLLRAGEVLEFTANVAKLSNVANLRLQVVERRNFLGKTAWHLQAVAHTENPLRMVFELDDQFDSYSDATSMASLQYEMHLNERGQKVDSVQRMTATGQEPAPSEGSQTRVLPGTRDPLGMLQYLRNVDWSKTPEVHGPVYDGHKLYDARARLAASASPVAVAAGNYTASKIDIHVFDNGVEMKDASFSLYLATDAAHTPVLLEAVLPVATARVELVKSR
jgi:Protein of unknown function (DUF3108)